ncbi:hypothetical protein EWM64_g10400 [Hericium alpestre]|uniref:Uncharacterized protein n=1 Tax=Hericium alpestre TaxID=135208 RepID=A0A4Y9ZGA0_9AGAM|nr:hypothetical protein EWM64_g10400 [Hericium alpestre]
MDDPWGNAWREPSTSQNATSSSWASKPAEPDAVTEEADIGAPSWSTGLGIRWDEPPDAPGAIWNQTSDPDPWSPTNPYHTIQLTQIPPPHASERSEPSTPTPVPLDVPLTPPPPEPPQTKKDEEAVASADVSRDEDELTEFPRRSPSPVPPSASSPDAFGTFEIGAKSDGIDPWTYEQQPSDDAWGSPWGNDVHGANGGPAEQPQNEGMDEWERARQEKEEMDRRLPPEFLATLLAQVEGFSDEAWPDPEPQEEAEWQKRWRTGLDGVEGLLASNSLITRYVPEMVLPQMKPFSTTFTCKAMADAVKLSRNTGLARNSPMAHFMAGRGATAWESHVRSRVDIAKDEVPLGWRIVEKEKEKDEKAEEKTKKSGGLLASLWNRRASSTPREAVKIASPLQDNPSKTEGIVSATRSSSESVRSTTSTGSKAVPTPTTSVSPTPTAASTKTMPTTSYSEAGLPSFDSMDSVSEVPAQTSTSAVSRFFGRFGRSRPAPGSSPRSSIALSQGDVEFLSDLVPSATDEDETQDPQFQGLESLIASKPVMQKLPAPLPPPPSAPIRPPSNGRLPGSHARTASGSLSSFDVLSPAPATGSPSPASVSVTPAAAPSLPSGSVVASAPLSRPITPAQPSAKIQAPRHDRTLTSPSLSVFSTPKNTTAPVSLFDSSPPLPSSCVPHASAAFSAYGDAMLSLQAESQSRTAVFPAPPPASRPQSGSPFSLSSISPTVSGPPTSQSHYPLTAFDDFDDFSDFHSSSVRAPLAAAAQDPFSDFGGDFATSASQAFPSASSSSQPLKQPRPSVSTSTNFSAFDDFSDFVSSPVRTPTPPQPPSKRTPAHISPQPTSTTSSMSVASGQSLAARRQGLSPSAHMHTLNLVESAAKSAGKRWPAPPSPLPQALPPPPPSTSTSSISAVDLLSCLLQLHGPSARPRTSTKQGRETHLPATNTPANAEQGHSTTRAK